MKQPIRFNMKSFLMAFGALILMGLGVILYIQVNVGVGSWDVLHASLTEYFPSITIGNLTIQLTVGRWIMIVGTIAVLASQLFHRNLFYLFSILTGIVQGYITDLWGWILTEIGFIDMIQTNLLTRWFGFFIAITALGFGVSLLVRSQFPPSPIDTLTMGLLRRFNLKFNTAKFSSEFIAFVTVLLINSIHGKPFNNMGLGTIVSLFLIGQIVAWSDHFWVRLLHLKESE